MTDRTARRRVVLYARTSVDRSEGRSVDDQLAELRTWATREGWMITGTFRDDGISASRYARGKQRAGWSDALGAITEGQCDALLVWEISRASRDRPVFAALFAACVEAGALLGTDGKLHDPSDPDDGFMLDLGAALAVRESAVTAKRVKRAARSRAETGRPNGRLNFGYMIEYDSTTGRALRRVPDPVAAPAVREAVARLLAGESGGEIARDFTARGISTRTGTAWTSTNVIKMAARPVYAGIRTSAVHDLPADHAGTWEPLISREDHDRLVAMLADPGRKSTRNGSHVRHLLAGVARCGKCGTGRIRTITRTSRRNGSKQVAYTCADCHGVSRPAEPCDEYVAGAVVLFLSRPDVLDQLDDARADSDRTAARADAAALRRKLAEVERAIDDGDLDVATGARLMRSTRDKLARAEAVARPPHVPSAVLDLAGPDAARRWEATPVSVRREIVRALFTVTIERGVVGGRPGFRPETVTIARRER